MTKQANVRKAEVTELVFQSFDECGTDLMLLVVLLVVVALLDAGITANWRDIDHAIPSI